MKKRDILNEVGSWSDNEITTLVNSLQQVIENRKSKDRLASELEKLAKNSGFTMESLGFVKESNGPAITRKARTLHAKNQSYIIADGKVAIAPPKRMKELRKTGELLRFNQLNEAQQAEAEALILAKNAR